MTNSARTTGNICQIFQASEDAFYMASRVGSRLCCSIYRLTVLDFEGDDVRFMRVAAGFVEFPEYTEDQNAFFSLKTGLDLLWSQSKDRSKRPPLFLMVDFDIDCNHDGTDGVKAIIGSSKDLQATSHKRNLLGKNKSSDLLLEKRNIGEVFFDGFRGSVFVLSKDYREAHIFS